MALSQKLDVTEDLDHSFQEENLSNSNFSMSAKVQETSASDDSDDGDDSDDSNHSADNEARGAGPRRDDSDDNDDSAGPRRGGPTRYRKDDQINRGGMQAEEQQRKTLLPAAQVFHEMTSLQRMVGRADHIKISAQCSGQTAVMPRDPNNAPRKEPTACNIVLMLSRSRKQNTVHPATSDRTLVRR